MKGSVWLIRIFLFFLCPIFVFSQSVGFWVEVYDEDNLALAGAVVSVEKKHQLTDSLGRAYFYASVGTVKVVANMVGYYNQETKINIRSEGQVVKLKMQALENMIDEVVVTDNMQENYRSNSVTAIEIYNEKFFKRNTTPNLFQALQMVNGVQPQLLCNVCNTGDIHINGLEGPYTLVMIDGMPIVSSLSSVYGLMGIPNNMIERIEIVKGPASTLYGSDAVGGIVNIITKSPAKSDKMNLDIHSTSWAETNMDFSLAKSLEKHQFLLGTNYFNFNQKIDRNNDGFTDVTLQHRGSVFLKYKLKRKQDRNFSIATRLFYEDRWGGETNWERKWRGTDSIYGESIYTKRLEFISSYRLPTQADLTWNNSYNFHDQNSVYGETEYMALQHTYFSQFIWQQKIRNRHHLTSGATFRAISLRDNTPISFIEGDSTRLKFNHQVMPGLFAQDEVTINEKHKLLIGSRIDHHNIHGLIASPRIGYKFSPNNSQTFRINAGNGFRVVNLFTEDHAALSGARTVEVRNELKPEKSWNANLAHNANFSHQKGFYNLESQVFYTYFSNRILPDYDTDPTKIIYSNLEGYSVSRGLSVGLEANFTNGLKVKIGNTILDVYVASRDSMSQLVKTQQVHTSRYQGNFLVSYTLKKIKTTIDYSGVVFSPMRLPIVENDFRPEYSPWFSLQNIQITHQTTERMQLYFGVKNLLNFVPQNPILRPNDPFDKRIDDPVGNPNGYAFDPTYNYAPIQGIRLLIGLRFKI